MSANLRRDVEQLLSHMPDNGFLQSLVNRLRMGMDLTPSHLTTLSEMKSNMVAQRALVEEDRARVLKVQEAYPNNAFLHGALEHLEGGECLSEDQEEVLSSVEDKVSRRLGVEKKGSVSRAWDYDRGEWAYRVNGGNLRYASGREVLTYPIKWGDPPKPNAWRAELVGRMSDGRIEVTSPLIVGKIVFEVYPHEIEVYYKRSQPHRFFKKTLAKLKRHDDMDSIFSHAVYLKYIKPAILKGDIRLAKALKVASGEQE